MSNRSVTGNSERKSRISEFLMSTTPVKNRSTMNKYHGFSMVFIHGTSVLHFVIIISSKARRKVAINQTPNFDQTEMRVVTLLLMAQLAYGVWKRGHQGASMKADNATAGVSKPAVHDDQALSAETTRQLLNEQQVMTSKPMNPVVSATWMCVHAQNH